MIKIFFLALAFIIPTASVAMEDDLESISPINSEVELVRLEVPRNCCSRGIWRSLARVGAWRQFFRQDRAQDRNEGLRDAAMNPAARRCINCLWISGKKRALGCFLLSLFITCAPFSYFLWGCLAFDDNFTKMLCGADESNTPSVFALLGGSIASALSVLGLVGGIGCCSKPF